MITKQELIDRAYAAMEHAYVPYSKFQVGAALLTAGGKVYTGCNIENASFGATNCAERTAIFKAVSEGEKDFLAMAIVSSSKDTTYPCGICRQVMAEFMKDGELYFDSKDGRIITIPVTKILPYLFDDSVLDK